MVENLLSITRIQDASVPLKKREEMLEEVAGDAVLTTRRRFPDANVQLDLSEDILFLPMEPMLIQAGHQGQSAGKRGPATPGTLSTSSSTCSARRSGRWWRSGTMAWTVS